MATGIDRTAPTSRVRLEHLSTLASELLDGLASIGRSDQSGPSVAPRAVPKDIELAVLVRQYLHARHRRNELFPRDLFADPAWDILLDLFASGIEGRPVSISSACIASQCPQTTALRWIGRLEELGLVGRIADGNDGRRSFLHLTRRAEELMRDWGRQVLQPLLDTR